MTFQFELGQQVKLIGSAEQGYVSGRADYLESAPSYFVRYRAADGRLTEAWWSGSALAAYEPVVGIAEGPMADPTVGNGSKNGGSGDPAAAPSEALPSQA
ncbi:MULTISPECIES: hypothetical protein [unclassified Methylobacterium]|uniref:hypothetical protein n=1 Tax=unclassified Methylobacterium TaxID=2615210 RepID=UPI0022699CA5|nr:MULTISPECIES: hypothetical protein [unclassified Methylobacterium]